MPTNLIITQNNTNPPIGPPVALGSDAYTNFTTTTGNPNGTLAGAVSDKAFDAANRVLYVCTTSGSVSSAVWTPIDGAVHM